MTRFVYNLLLRALFPLLFVALVIRGWRNPQVAIPWRERLAWSRAPLPPSDGPPLWVHAVSLGEVQAAAALVAALRRRDPRRTLLCTVGTLTGMQRARTVFAAQLADGGAPVVLAYAPMDLTGAVRRFLDHFRPAALVLLEMEIWPNLLKACDARSIPVAIASARLSAQSARRYRNVGRTLMLSALRRVRVIATQGADDATRFVEVGARPEQVQVAGNLKFDFALPAGLAERGTALRAAWGGTRAWVAGSTHAGEEAACLAAQRHLEARLGEAAPLLMLVPRLTGRFREVADDLTTRGIAFARRSDGAPPLPAGARVLLVDTLGELLQFYAAADAAFVGGTLVPVGGHNLLEPAALGLPVVCGPHTHNGPQIARLLEGAGALRVVASGQALGDVLEQWFTDEAARVRAGAAGLAAVEQNRGAVQRCVAILAPMLPAPL